METGCIQLSELYSYVKNDPKGHALHGNSKEGRKFGRLAKGIVGSIKNEHGFYLWGKYEANGLWRHIYLGKAGYGKTASLQARILEELKDEKAFLWRNTIDEETLLAIGKKHYPKMWYSYEKHWKRAFRKVGSTHIIWVTTPDLNNKDVEMVESDLIETINPIANYQRPTPKSELQDYTVKVIKSFKHHIHKNRN
jgi:hypothetical protein